MTNNLEILKLLLPLLTGNQNQNQHVSNSDDFPSDYIGKYCVIRTYSGDTN